MSRGDTETVAFMGFDLTVELDADGTIEGIVSPDGGDCYCMFADWAITDIAKLVEKQRKQAHWNSQYDRGAELAEEMAEEMAA